jgi:hypothetical protein
MGTGFTVDTPVRVARFGISSVISIGDDILIEKMRRHHSAEQGKPFAPIGRGEEDSRARRITAYLNLVDELVREQIADVRSAPFEPGSDITRYFEMLPDCQIKTNYNEMLSTTDSGTRSELEQALRQSIVPGDIDVNIMTKADRDEYRDGEKQPPENALAMSALRGFAESRLHSSVVLSAGMNRRLFKYMLRFPDFMPANGCRPVKTIVLKVSDYRSAILQGRTLAKLGLWVWEYRIESGLNCGGHAFATKGKLLGPILEEFRVNRERMRDELWSLCTKALAARGIMCAGPLPQIVTVQGGIGTNSEHRYLFRRYDVTSTGWGTPFLLVPEVTNVDVEHLKKLAVATDRDVGLSDNSPLGVPFWSLRTSASEKTRQERIDRGKPGSPCIRGFLGLDSEFSEVPICRASRLYQRKKSEQVATLNLTPEALKASLREIRSRACICVDLAGGALLRHGLSSSAHTAVCCGPNISNFSRVASLKEMVDHVYGRLSLVTKSNRPHMFLKELSLYVGQLRTELGKSSSGLIDRTANYFSEFVENLEQGVDYYREMAADFAPLDRTRFLEGLESLSREIELIGLRLQSVSPALPVVVAREA